MDFEDLSDADVEKTIAATRAPPLLIAFRAKENQLCGDVEQQLSKLGYKDELRLGRMDVETNPETRERFGILSVPNLVLFKGSVDLRSGWIGPWSDEKVQEFLKEHL
jgi:thioredoxin 1